MAKMSRESHLQLNPESLPNLSSMLFGPGFNPLKTIVAATPVGCVPGVRLALI